MAGDQAVGLVSNELQRLGEDPVEYEYSAKLIDDQWNITAYRIFYPENKGSSRFVPGGFTMYIISTNGVILKTIPGK